MEFPQGTEYSSPVQDGASATAQCGVAVASLLPPATARHVAGGGGLFYNITPTPHFATIVARTGLLYLVAHRSSTRVSHGCLDDTPTPHFATTVARTGLLIRMPTWCIATRLSVVIFLVHKLLCDFLTPSLYEDFPYLVPLAGAEKVTLFAMQGGAFFLLCVLPWQNIGEVAAKPEGLRNHD